MRDHPKGTPNSGGLFDSSEHNGYDTGALYLFSVASDRLTARPTAGAGVAMTLDAAKDQPLANARAVGPAVKRGRCIVLSG
jgi:hypothetical protein